MNLRYLLFILYINYIADCINPCHCVWYADDTTISLSNKLIICLTSVLNAVLNIFIHGCPENYIIINPEKTSLMIFSSYQKTINIFPELKLGPHLIAPCDSVTCLGIHVDHILTCKSPIFNLKQKTAIEVRAFIKARRNFPHYALLHLYFAFVHSRFHYGIVSWCNAYSSHVSSVQHIPNQCIRIITFS